MIVEVHHCEYAEATLLVSEESDGVNPPRQFVLAVSQHGREFVVTLDTGDSIDFEPGTVADEPEFDEGLRRPRRLYTHRETYK